MYSSILTSMKAVIKRVECFVNPLFPEWACHVVGSGYAVKAKFYMSRGLNRKVWKWHSQCWSQRIIPQRSCKPHQCAKPGPHLLHPMHSHLFSPQVRFLSELIIEFLTSVFCLVYCNFWYLRAYWLRNSTPMCETRFQFYLKIWCNWQMFIITQIHTSGKEIQCPEISVMLPSEFYHIWVFLHTKIYLLYVKCTLRTTTNLPPIVSILKEF